MKIEFKGEPTPSAKEWCGLRIWEKPKETHVYALGADVAEGVGKDASCAQVINCNTGLLVANYWSDSVDVDNYAADLFKLGHYYNKATICIESNNHGHAVISHLSGQIGGLAYPKLYKREVYDEYTRKKTQKVGFRTSADTKPRIIEGLKAALRDGELLVLDKLTILEATNFIRDAKTGRIGSQGNAKDDRIMALALAWEQAKIIKKRLENSKNDYREDELVKYDPSTGFPIY